MAATPHDGSGTSFSFAGTNYTVTSITWTLGATGGGGGADAIDISHLGQTTGASVLSQPRPLIGSAGTTDTGKSVSIEYIGNGPIAQNATGTLTITGGVSVSAVATCNSSSVTLTVNDVVRGTADFSLA
jgi:hypothetical protein